MSQHVLDNPFTDDIVKEPRQIGPSIDELNQLPLQRLVQTFATLEEGLPPRPARRVTHAQLVRSTAAGYGKSHLLGRLFEQLAGRATLVNVRPFRVANNDWQSLLQHTVDELCLADRFTTAHTSANPSQLVVFAHGVLSHLVATLPSTTHAKNLAPVLRDLQHAPLTTWQLGQHHPAWAKRVNKAMATELDGLLQAFGQYLPATRAKPVSWLRLLHALAFRTPGPRLEQSLLDWLKAEAVSEEHLREIGLHPGDAPPMVMPMDGRNALAKTRMLDLCRLAGFFRPFLFCFDQTETYGDSKKLARALGQLVQEMQQELPHQLTVLTANLAPWRKKIAPHWEVAALDRLASSLDLDGLTLDQGRALIRQRLDGQDHPADLLARLDDASWLTSLFAHASQMGVRAFLRACSARWQGNPHASSTPDSLPERLHRLTRQVLAQPAKLLFEENLLLWGVETALAGTGPLKRQHQSFTLHWRPEGKVHPGLMIHLDRSNHWQHWHGIARRHLGTDRPGPAVYIRTPEQAVIPEATWKVAAPDILNALQQGSLRIVVLSREELANLYAAWELHADTVAGNLIHDSATVTLFLQQCLQGLGARLTATDHGITAQPVDPVPPATDQEPDLSPQITQVLAKFKLGVTVVERVPAPQLIRYCLRPDDGIRTVSLASRAKDLQVHLGLEAPPVIASAPGCVTLDIPRARPVSVLWQQWWPAKDPQSGHSLRFPLGVGVDNHLTVADLAEVNQCHLLVGGSTGSGKSTFLRSVVASLMVRNTPQTLLLAIVDTKRLTFPMLEGSPFLSQPVVEDVNRVTPLLAEVVEDMEQRYRLLKKERLASLHQWQARGDCPLPFRVVVFDEFAELMLTTGSKKAEFEKLVNRLAGKARAAGIHLVLATQRPDRTTVTGAIKSNLTLKVCLRVNSGINARIILDDLGGEKLLGHGDLLATLGPQPIRLQSLLLSDKELAQAARVPLLPPAD